ncbi:MAG: cache domain-containing protein, partial [Deltaproteobacteria bacterium]|nr:cache domain-containing protein [Deltaproteobacteria bacterium]
MKINLQSISSKLILGGLAAVLIPLIVVGYLSFSKAQTALMNVSKVQAQGIASDLARMTYNTLQSEMDKASTLATQKAIVDLATSVKTSGVESSGSQAENVYNSLKRQFVKLGDHYQGIYIADSNGQIFNGVLKNGDVYKGINIANGEYFQRAKDSGGAVISEMTISKATGKNIIMACAPIKSNSGAFLGVLGTVIDADEFSGLISERKIGQTGYGYMIDQKGLILAHPKIENIMKLDVTSIGDMASINKHMMAGETGVEQYVFKETPKIAGFAPVGVNGWSIGATQDQIEFLAASNSIRNSNILVALV